MDTTGQDQIDRLDREAEREKTSGDSLTAEAHDGKPLIVTLAAVLVATVLVLGMMWMNNMRYEGPGQRPVAEQHE